MAGGEDEQSVATGEEATDPGYVSPEEPSSTGAEEYIPSWEDVKDRVSGGSLKMVNDAAFRCASATADLYYACSSVRSFVDRNASCDVPLSSLPEGKVFADRIAAKRVEFLEILDKVLDTVQLKHETFVEAGKLYEETEDVAAQNFDSLALREFTYTPPAQMSHGASVIDAGGSGNPYPLFMNNFHPPDPATDPAEGVAVQTDVELATTGFINPTTYDPNASAYLMMYELGEYIRNNWLPEYLGNLASVWGQVGTVLNGIFEDYVDVLEAITADDWTGPASAYGIAAIEGDKLGVKNISPGPFGMRDLYSYLAYWFDQASKALPTDPNIPQRWEYNVTYTPIFIGPVLYVHEEQDNQAYINEWKISEYLNAMEATYTDPLEKADSSIPVLPAFMTDSPSAPLTEDYAEIKRYDGGGGLDPSEYQSTGSGAGPISSSMPDYSSPDYSSFADDRAAEQEEWARAQREAAQQQALQSALQQGISAAHQALDQGMRLAQRAAESAAQSLAPSMLPSAPGNLDSAAMSAFKPSALGGAGTAGVGSGTGSGTPKGTYDASRLFPRAGLAPGATTSLTAGTPMAGMPMAGVPGAPGAAGAPGAGARPGQDDKHERAKYLNRADNIDEALGDAPDMARPVVGEGSTRPVSGQPPTTAAVRPAPERPSAPGAPAPSRNQTSQQQVAVQSDQ